MNRVFAIGLLMSSSCAKPIVPEVADSAAYQGQPICCGDTQAATNCMCGPVAAFGC